MWVTPEDILTRWLGEGDSPTDTNPIFLTLIEDAETLITLNYPQIGERVELGTLDVRLIKMVVSAMVQRAWQSSLDGKTQYSYSSGPFSESGSFGDSKRGLYLTEDEMQLLAPNVDAGKAFSINMDTGHVNFWEGNYGPGVYGANVWIPTTLIVGSEPYGD